MILLGAGWVGEVHLSGWGEGLLWVGGGGRVNVAKNESEVQ